MIKYFIVFLLFSFSTFSIAEQSNSSIQNELVGLKNLLLIKPAQETLWNAYVNASLKTIDYDTKKELSNIKTVIELHMVLDRIQSSKVALFELRKQATLGLYQSLTARQRFTFNSFVLQNISTASPGLTGQ